MPSSEPGIGYFVGVSPLTSSFLSDQDGLRVATTTWTTGADRPRGVVQISHGLAEHVARYGRFAEALNAAGFHVVGSDHRGHGRTIADVPGDFGEAGFEGLWRDVVQLGEGIRAEYTGLPVFLFGHSMGSFAGQHVLVERSDLYDGVILSGSTAIDVIAAGMAGAPAGDLSVFNAAFEHRTGYEWLSRDEAEVDLYVADPLCGFDLPETTVPALFAGGSHLADPEVLGHIRPDLPLLIASGSDDPLAGGGDLIELIGSRYREAGLQDVTVILYPGARHEILNETNRDEVTRDILAWLDDHTG
ncbi:alpha/beta hydrolase [Aeromicrobium sp. PE09-221]|nr:alpha/beta hydrolase [Aeromicrobium sp. PE09-221]